jgi:general secretion pathway protein B
MSYILDALRRAEAERERGQVPGLGAQPTPAPAPPSSAATPGLARGLAWAAALLGLALLLAWWLWPRGDASAPHPASNAGTAAPSVADAGTGRPSPPGMATPLPAAAPDRPEPPVAPQPSPAATPAPVPLPLVVSAPPPPPARAPSPPAVVAPPSPASAPRAAGTRVVPVAELSPEQRRSWPAPSIGGAVYSDHAPSRFVIVGGQILHEGGTAAPGLTVERIGPRAVVFRWRDALVEVPF